MTDPVFDLSVPRSIHVMAAGGSGMSAIATLLAGTGHAVTGCDAVASPTLDRLAVAGVAVAVGHDPAHVGGVDVVTASTAIPTDHPELAAARAAGVPVLRRAGALAALCATRRAVAVSGTHGKTSTTALLAAALEGAGLGPSWLVGADLVEGPSARWGEGELFVVEADESDGTFTQLDADAVLVTNVEPDHLDHHGSVGALEGAFRRFLEGGRGPRVVCADDAGAVRVAAGIPCTTYGAGEAAEVRLSGLERRAGSVAFDVSDRGEALGRVELGLPGAHSALNATGAVAMALRLGAPFDGVEEGLRRFRGVRRRFEHRGRAGGVTFVDSYDHLPGEVAAVLATAADGGWDRVVCTFQPHRYTRTAALWQDFGPALAGGGADLVVVTEIYAAGQAPIPGVSGELVVQAVRRADAGQRVEWVPDRRDLVAFLVGELRAGDLCLTLGAGDLTTLPDEVLEVLSSR